MLYIILIFIVSLVYIDSKLINDFSYLGKAEIRRNVLFALGVQGITEKIAE
jgi:hypothetical protein